MAFRVFRRLRDLLDVDTSGAVAGDALVLDVDGETWIPGAGGGGGGSDDQTAAEVPFTPAGGIASADVQAALEELDAEKASASAFADHSARHEDGGADEISVAGLSGLLADGQTPLAHVHDGGDVTTGTVADARIAATIARDSEVTSAVSAEATARDSAISSAVSAHVAASDPHPTYTTATELAAYAQPIDSDLTAIAALTTTSFGRNLLALADAPALLAAAGAQGSDSDLTAIAALTTTAYGRSLLELANAAALRTAGGVVIGTDVQAHDADLDSIAALSTTSFGRSLLEAANAAALRTLAGTVIGTDVEAHDADLTTIAGLSPSNDDVLQRKAGAWTNRSMAQLLADLGITGGGRTLIQKITVPTGGQASVDFTSIPQTYQHLEIDWTASSEGTSAQNLFGRINNDSSASYHWQFWEQGGTSTQFSQTSGILGVIPNTGVGVDCRGIISIMHYTLATFHSVLARFGGFYSSNPRNGGTSFIGPGATGAITRFTIFPAADDIKEGSVFSLYGLA